MKNVLITGSGIGIGAATAKAFGLLGYRVIVTDILINEGKKIVSEINDNGGEASFFEMNVASTNQVNKVVSEVEQKFGEIDTLVCNAGIAKKVPLSVLTDEKWDETLDIDLKGIFRVIRAAAPGMKKKSYGSIICLSSCMGIQYGWDEHVHYSAAKSGVVGLVRGLAVELAKNGIRVNGIAPGFIRTAQALSEEHSLGEKGLEKSNEFIPFGVGEPEDVADVITFLSSKSSRYITGQTISVDGGLLVGRY